MLQKLRQEECVGNNSGRRMSLEYRTEQLGRRECDRGDGMGSEGKVGDNEF